MSARILDGKALAERVTADVRERVAARVAIGRATPGLAVVLVGENAASQVYVRNKRKTTDAVGMPNMREGKVERLTAWLDERGCKLGEFRESWFYSDSQNDLPLLSRVTHPVAVNPDAVLAAHARHKGWPQIALA